MVGSNTNKFLLIVLVAIVLVSGCTENAQDQQTNSTKNETVNQTQDVSTPSSDYQTNSTNDEAINQTQDIIFRQTVIFSQLNGIGINDSLIDITNERILVRYNLPENLDKSKVYYLVMGISAKVTPESERIEIENYKDFKSFEKASVKTKDVLDFVNDKIDFESFNSKISYSDDEFAQIA